MGIPPPYQRPQSTRHITWGFVGFAIGVLLTVSIAAIVLAAREARSRPDADSLSREYMRLSQKIPNLRVFPGWDGIDNRPFVFSQCRVESVSFQGNINSPKVTVVIANRSAAATQPRVEVSLFDRRGEFIASAEPVDFWRQDFRPGETKTMPDDFLELPQEPVFYCLGEPLPTTQ